MVIKLGWIMPYPKDNEIICFISANINQYCHNLEESNFFGDFLIRKKPTPKPQHYNLINL